MRSVAGPGLQDEWPRWVRTGLRTLHLVAFGALYGALLLDVEPARLTAPTLAVGVTGGAFVVFELARCPSWLLQVRGLVTLVKVGLLAIVVLRPSWGVVAATLAVVLGSVVSHAPGRLRYHSPWRAHAGGSDGGG